MNEQPNPQEALDLRSYFRPVWRRKWIILTIVVVSGAATYLISSRQQKQYVATTSLYVQVADPTLNVGGAAPQAAPTSQSLADVAQLVTAQSVTNAVAQTLGISVVSARSVTASPATGSSFVTVTATSHSPVLAAALANGYASEFLQSRERVVAAEAGRALSAAQATLAGLPNNGTGLANLSQRQTLLQQIETYKQTTLNPSAGASQINRAVVPKLPSSPQPKRDAIFGAVVGLVLGLIAAFCLELLDRRLTRVSTIESLFGRPVLAVLPHVSDPTPLVEGQQPVVPMQFLEELRSLTVVLRLAGQSAPRTIMVTSTLPREGKSTVTRDLALVYAETGERVLVIDGDLRRPSMERLFGLKAERGLAQLLRGEATLAQSALPASRPPDVVAASTNGNGSGPAPAHHNPQRQGLVDVLPHGEVIESPLGLLSSEAMMTLLAEAAELYDVVLLDTPPVLTVADTVPLLEVVDSVLLVARIGHTTRHAAGRFTDLIGRLSEVNFSGVIANDRREKFDDEGYGSYGRYGYGYYQGTKRDKQKASSPTS
jgi:Mrp family chromosome partitioning ATPase/capsular polysaccharide biosynthesis protein